jgi:transporter family protein
MYRVKDLLVGDKMGIFYGLLAGLIGTIGMIGFYFVMTRKDASAAVPLTALYPALTAILAFIFLREQLTFVRVVGILLATVAVVLLSL